MIWKVVESCQALGVSFRGLGILGISGPCFSVDAKKSMEISHPAKSVQLPHHDTSKHSQ